MKKLLAASLLLAACASDATSTIEPPDEIVDGKGDSWSRPTNFGRLFQNTWQFGDVDAANRKAFPAWSFSVTGDAEVTVSSRVAPTDEPELAQTSIYLYKQRDTGTWKRIARSDTRERRDRGRLAVVDVLEHQLAERLRVHHGHAHGWRPVGKTLSDDPLQDVRVEIAGRTVGVRVGLRMVAARRRHTPDEPDQTASCCMWDGELSELGAATDLAVADRGDGLGAAGAEVRADRVVAAVVVHDDPLA